MRLPVVLTALALLGALAPAASASEATPGLLAIEDPAGDVRLEWQPEGLASPALPALAQALDITGLTLANEDEEGFDLVLRLAGIDPRDDQLQRHFAAVTYEVGFDLTGSPFRYVVHLAYEPLGNWDWDWDAGLAPSVEPEVWAYLAAAERRDATEEEAHTSSFEGIAHLEALVDYDADTIQVRVPRAALEREDGAGALVGPLPGDAIGNVQGRSTSWWPAPATDLAPDAGPAEGELVLALPTANGLVRLGLPVPAEPHGDEDAADDEDDAHEEEEQGLRPSSYELPKLAPVAVNLGAPSVLTLELTNRGAAPQVVRLAAGVGSEAPGFAVRAPDVVEVAPGQAVLVKLVATLVEPVAHRTTAEAVVEGFTGAGDLARLRVPLVASAGPTSEAATLRLHTAPWETANPVMGALGPMHGHRVAWLNALEQDPLADDAALRLDDFLDLELGTDRTRVGVLGRNAAHAAMDTPLARPLVLAEGAPVLLQVGLRSSAAEDGVLRAAVFTGDQLLARGEAAASLAAGQDTPVPLELVPEALDPSAGEDADALAGVALWVAWEPAPLVGAPVRLHASAPRELWLVPALTQLTLPIDAAVEQDVGPLVVVPEPTEEQTQLDSNSASTRAVPGPAALLAGGAVLLAALLVRRRR